MRAIFIVTGAALLENFHWMIYVFGAFLIVTGIKMLLQGEEKLEPQQESGRAPVPALDTHHQRIPRTTFLCAQGRENRCHALDDRVGGG
jgi:predicted tellurium resistance membrane protein TerC